MPKPEFKPGIYQHYKGGLYHAIFVAKHHHNRRDYVVYLSLKHGTVNLRPLESGDPDDPDGFFGVVGQKHMGSLSGAHEDEYRFTYVGPPPG